MLAIIRGAGDIASAIALRLHKCGASVIMTEVEHPLTVRRTVAFSEAIHSGKTQVEASLACVLKASMMRCDEHSKGSFPCS